MIMLLRVWHLQSAAPVSRPLQAPALLAPGWADTHFVSRRWLKHKHLVYLAVTAGLWSTWCSEALKPSTCLKCQQSPGCESQPAEYHSACLAPKYPPAPIQTYFRSDAELLQLHKVPRCLLLEKICQPRLSNGLEFCL